MTWVKEGTPPVILVHGFLGTRGTMVPLTRRLQADGLIVFSHAHGTFNMASIRASAEGLMSQIRQICDELEVPRVDVVGFSMGGLIALHAIKFLQGHQHVRRLCTLGTPFMGSWVSLAGIACIGALCPSVWQIVPGSTFLAELHGPPIPACVRVRQIHASQDAFVPVRGRLEGVRREDYLVLPGGHSSLVVAEHFYAAVHDFIAADEPTTSKLRTETPIPDLEVPSEESRHSALWPAGETGQI